MNITITGGLVVLFLLVLLLKNGIRKLLIDPRLYILVMYWNFFGKTQELPIDYEADFLLAFSFCLFWGVMLFVSHRKFYGPKRFLYKIVNRIDRVEELRPVSLNMQFILFTIIVIYTISDIYINSVMYGSFENAMTRFYYKLPVDSFPQYYTTLLNTSYMFCLGILFILRYSAVYFKRSKAFFYMGLLLLLIVTFPRGSRGAMLAAGSMPFMADLFIICLKKYSFRYFFKPMNCVIYGLLIFLAFFMTAIRNQDFDNISEVTAEAADFSISTGVETYSENETDLIMKDYYNVLDIYGNKKDFLPIYYTFYSVIVNPIPRSIYPSKPIGFGRILAADKIGLYNAKSDQILKTLVSSFAVGICGEGWANGGFLGVIIYSILLGSLSGFFVSIYNCFIRQPSFLCILIALLAYKSSSSFIRGDILSGVTGSIYPFLMTVFILFTVGRLKQFLKS